MHGQDNIKKIKKNNDISVSTKSKVSLESLAEFEVQK